MLLPAVRFRIPLGAGFSEKSVVVVVVVVLLVLVMMIIISADEVNQPDRQAGCFRAKIDNYVII